MQFIHADSNQKSYAYMRPVINRKFATFENRVVFYCRKQNTVWTMKYNKVLNSTLYANIFNLPTDDFTFESHVDTFFFNCWGYVKGVNDGTGNVRF